MLVLTQHGLLGSETHAPFDASYLADTVLAMRYYEIAGEVKQTISVVKKRTGRHERTIREILFDDGITIGSPVSHYRAPVDGSQSTFGVCAVRTA